jgi:hypothetical protein
MKFLRGLFWVTLVVLLGIFSHRNWHSVTLHLWSDVVMDINLPLLLAFMFFLGFLPPLLILRARLWTYRKRLDSFERQQAAADAMPPPIERDPAE